MPKKPFAMVLTLVVLEQMFDAMDTNSSNTVDFKEFIDGLAALWAGSSTVTHNAVSLLVQGALRLKLAISGIAYVRVRR